MSLLSVSPVDGRYSSKTSILSDYFSEYALIKYRVFVEIKWLIYLIENDIVSYDKNVCSLLMELFDNFNLEEAEKVKGIEAITKHDVKAVEYYLQEVFKKNDISSLIPYIHIPLTSEDINNTSYNLMVSDFLNNIYYSKINELTSKLNDFSNIYKSVAMLSHTHGQNATPTTVGNEFKIFEYRINSILEYLKSIKLKSKFSGAVGNYNCHVVAYPDVDWIDVTKGFVNSLGLVYNPLTTQIETHDVLCLLLSNVKIINNIIKDLNSDMWLYISRSYLNEKSKKNEVGSSVMPHKVNPINHENSMANIEISNSLIDALLNNLSISRMQRDLSDSSKMRNLGVIFAHCLISISETIIGLNKIEVNDSLLKEELNSHWEVLSEAIQTVLRKNGCMDAYEKLKELSRGKVVTEDDVVDFINGLDINSDDKNRLLELRPDNYIGLCERIVNEN